MSLIPIKIKFGKDGAWWDSKCAKIMTAIRDMSIGQTTLFPYDFTEAVRVAVSKLNKDGYKYTDHVVIVNDEKYLEVTRRMGLYAHVAYICGRKDDGSGLMTGDTVICMGEGVELSGIRNWLADSVKKNSGDGWNLPSIIQFQILDELTAKQLAPELCDKNNISITNN